MLGRADLASSITAQSPPYPDLLDYLWKWFEQNSLGMAAGGMSYPRITWEGLRAWSSLMQIEIEPWEAELMISLSTIRAGVHAETKPPPR